MRTITTETNVYSIDELRDDYPEAYEKALEKHADINVDHEWYEYSLEYHAEQWEEKYGICFDWKGVCFDLDRAFWISFDQIWLHDHKAFYRALEMSHGEKLAMSRGDLEFCFHTAHYGQSTSIDAKDWRPDTAPDLTVDVDQWFTEICQKLLYSLRNEHEGYMTEEAIHETLKINEYEFTLDGEIF